MDVICEDIVFLSKGRLPSAESRDGQPLVAVVNARNPQNVCAERPQDPLCIKPTQ
jgi:hypothetical protein